jgi:hypothetical protein
MDKWAEPYRSTTLWLLDLMIEVPCDDRRHLVASAIATHCDRSRLLMLLQVVRRESINKMSATNMAIVVGPNLYTPSVIALSRVSPSFVLPRQSWVAARACFGRSEVVRHRYTINSDNVTRVIELTNLVRSLNLLPHKARWGFS